jgi:transposase
MDFTSLKFVPAPPLVCVELNPGPPPLSNKKRKKIVKDALKLHLSEQALAEKYGVHVKSVRALLNKVAEEGSVRNRPGQGRKRKLNRQEEKLVVKKAKQEKDAPEISKIIFKKFKKKVSDTTVQRTINRDPRMGYLVIQEQEELTKSHKQKRLKFARKRQDDNFRYWFFADEKDFQLGSGKKKAWQDREKRIKRKVKRWPKKIHVWGGIGYYFKSKLYFFEENMDANLYQKILEQRLPPEPSPDCPSSKRTSWILLQDNDPKHKAKATTEYLNKVAPDRIKDFPALSPDFNIIEDIWSQLDSKIKATKITTIRGLKGALQKAWTELPWQTVRKSVQSMPHRLKQCITLKGDRTNY